MFFNRVNWINRFKSYPIDYFSKGQLYIDLNKFYWITTIVGLSREKFVTLDSSHPNSLNPDQDEVTLTVP